MPPHRLRGAKREHGETTRPQRGYACFFRFPRTRFQKGNQPLEACCWARFRLDRASLLRIRVVASTGILGKIHIQIQRQQSRHFVE